ncbi:MAG: tRNA nucleotidyltransferase [Pseudomonadota bacterium]|nr:tRNA nucleotidyltransferase [Pseudomonadota bacterium]
MFDLKRLFAPLAGTDLDHLEIYVVGGAVRDSLLGLIPKDVDFVAVGTTPDTFLELGFQQVGQDFPVFLHPKSHTEIALARTERKTHKGHTGFVVHADPAVTLETDLLRRDFTINAMAVSRTGDLIDPYGGENDLQSQLLRHVSEAFSEDPLRVLRGIRFLAQLGVFEFQLAPETRSMMQSMSPFLVELSVERIVVELDKTLSSSHPHLGLQHLSDLGITNTLVPALKTLPDQFLCQSTDARLAEWMILNQPTMECIDRYGKKFRLTKRRTAFLKAITRLKDLALEDAALCLHVFGQLGWLRGNQTDEGIDQLLIDFGQSFQMTVPIGRWFEIRQRVRQVSAEQFTEQGLSGQALGDAIYAERLSVLSTEISAPGTAPGL